MLIFYSALFGRKPKLFPMIFNNSLPNCEIVTSKYYKGESLWGLINGGADVYLEYGFDKLLFQEVKWENNNYRVEIYKMESPESAFGIYSISKFRCSDNDFNNQLICITPYQVQGCAGEFYISIANEVGDSLNQDATLKIYKLIEKQITKSEFQIPSKIKSFVSLPYYSDLKYIRGHLGLQNGFPDWFNLFEDIENFSVYLYETKNGDDSIIMAEIRFENKDESNIFVNIAESIKNNIHIEKLPNGNIFVIEGAISEEELKKESNKNSHL